MNDDWFIDDILSHRLCRYYLSSIGRKMMLGWFGPRELVIPTYEEPKPVSGEINNSTVLT